MCWRRRLEASTTNSSNGLHDSTAAAAASCGTLVYGLSSSHASSSLCSACSDYLRYAEKLRSDFSDVLAGAGQNDSVLEGEHARGGAAGDEAGRREHLRLRSGRQRAGE